MSSLSRSIKSSSYLSTQYRNRPSMGGRTFSNSSERSHNSDDGSDRPTDSGRTTPQAYQTRRYPPPNYQPPSASSSSSAAVPSGDLATGECLRSFPVTILSPKTLSSEATLLCALHWSHALLTGVWHGKEAALHRAQWLPWFAGPSDSSQVPAFLA